MAASQTDRNLLVAVIALQLDILDQSQFAEVCAVWALTMDRPIDELLEERGWITREDRQEITRNLERKLRKHCGDIHASLAATADTSVREILRSIDQPAIRQSIDELPPATGHILATLILPEGTKRTLERYTLSRVHGEGGLGRVWLARDTDLNRNVALKEVRVGKSADARYLRRFLKEAQVTGQLEHPNIVPVYELARRKDDDQPFYTMRFVEGRTLAKEIAGFHEERAGKPLDRLALQRRLLEPFVKICEAIGYAHSRNVVHRDLKPGNVVLGDHGEVIVLDWGLAKLLQAPGGPEATVADDAIALSPEAETDQTQGPVGTPAYMAPEQVAADIQQIDTRTDLYGLGAILFTILANRPPASGATLEEVLQDVAAGHIPRAREVDSTVPRPLDAICAKALSPSREDRYQSAAALADDVRRWMIDEPVSVYRDPLTVRLTRRGRRHRTLVTTATAVLFVTATAAALVASQQAAHANAIGRKNTELTQANTALALQRKKAEEREQLAIAAVKRFGDAVSRNSELKANRALESLRKELLKEPLTFFKTLRDQLQADRDTRSESLGRLASAAYELGLLTYEIGDRQDALRAWEESLVIYERLARENPNVTDFQSDLAKSHNNIGLLQSATGRPDQALESYDRALLIWERLARENPNVTEFQSDLAKSHNNIGVLQSATGHPDQALESHGRALAIWERLAQENPAVTDFQRNLAFSHNNIGAIQSATGHPDQALESYGRALAIRERLARENPTVTEFQSDLAKSHNNIGVPQSAMGHPDEALESFGRALAIRERLAREHPESPDFASQLGGTLHNMAQIDLDQKRYSEARTRLEQAIVWQKKALAAYPKHPQFRQFLANHLRNLIRAANGLNDPSAVAEAQREVNELNASDPRFAALDARLAAILKGEAPHDNPERLALARRAYDTARHAAAVRLWAEALERDPKLADDRRAQHRYNAACAAALAASGKDKDDPAPDEAAKAKLRNQARDWLDAELAVWSKLLETANPKQRAAIAQTLKHWQDDTDLAGVREPKAIDALPESERDGWRTLWKNVAEALARAQP
jgi:serine/threonine-protein kinase